MDQFRPKDFNENTIRDVRRSIDKYGNRFFRFFPGKAVGIAILALILLYFATGFYIVGPGERAVVLLFGKYYEITEPGPRYKLPYPFMSKTLVDISTVRRAEIGFRSEKGKTRQIPGESLMLTGDENIVDVQLFVQYNVSNPETFLYGCEAPEQVLRASAEVALRGVVGENNIDYTMTSGKLDIQKKVEINLQKLLDQYQTGILVTQASLLVVDPPAQVQQAFHDVVRALEDRERLIREAEGYMEDVVPKAKGQAQQLVREAEAYKAQRTIRADGDAQRFNSVLAEYLKSPKVTRERIYLETAESFMPPTKKFVIDPSATKPLPLLPLTGFEQHNKVQMDGAAEKKGN